jgi:hypothetical protein
LGSLRVNIAFLLFLRMADPEHPLPLATVIWFGSLEFMSLGYGYDMVLLPPDTQPTNTTSSPIMGERYAGITVPARLVQPGDDMPSVATIIISRRVTACSVPAPLGQTPTQHLSLRTCIG